RGQGSASRAGDLRDPGLRRPHRAHAEGTRSPERARALEAARAHPLQPLRHGGRIDPPRGRPPPPLQDGGWRMTLEAAAPTPDHGTTASGSSFYAAMRVLPREQREAMFQIYSFCRKVDDIADSNGPRDERLAALQRWRDDIDALYQGRPPER